MPGAISDNDRSKSERSFTRVTKHAAMYGLNTVPLGRKETKKKKKSKAEGVWTCPQEGKWTY